MIRTPRTLPRVVDPAEVDALLGACRTRRDRAMFEAMVLGGLRRCEVLGLRLTDLDAAYRQVFQSDDAWADVKGMLLSAHEDARQ